MTTIKLKNGSGAPTSGDLVQGEPALDLTNKRLYTEDSGGTVIEVGTNPGTDVTFADNRKALFGAGSDLQIYHDGSNSYIDDTATGHLFIRSNGDGIYLRSSTNEEIAHFNVNGSVKAYYDNSLKLETTSTGIDVTGTVNADGLTVDGKVLINTPASAIAQEIKGRSSNDVGYLQFSNNAGTTSSYIGSNGSYLNFEVGSAERMRITSGGNVGINTSNPSAPLNISATYSSDTTEQFRIEDNTGGKLDFFGYANGGKGIQAYADDGSTFYNLNLQPLGGNVGIGTDSPSSKLEVNGDGTTVRLDGTANTSRNILIRNVGGSAEGVLQTDGNMHLLQEDASKYMRFSTANTEAMRIDASGNVLVGTTVLTDISSSGTGNEGAFIQGYGHLGIAVSNDKTATFNRKTSDGAILEFRKDGTAVGSIGTVSGDVTIDGGSEHTGLRFEATDITPRHNGAASDGVNDLGTSGARFKDLYLSGGAYLGGVASANLLDDYEEGTWDPVWTPESGTIVTNTSFSGGSYTKIGNIVHVHARLYTSNVTSPAGEITISGLPFAVENNNENRGAQLFTMNAITGTLSGVPILYFKENTSTAIVLDKVWDSTEFTGDIANHFDNDTWGYFYGVYRTA